MEGAEAQEDGTHALVRSLVVQCCRWVADHIQSVGSLTSLPLDLRETILESLHQRGLLNDDTFALLYAPAAGFSRLKMTAYRGITERGLSAFLERCHDSLTELAVSSQASTETLQHVGRLCKRLRSLKINNPPSSISEDTFKCFFDCEDSDMLPNLQTLQLNKCRAVPSGSLSSKWWSGLRRLSIIDCPEVADPFIYAAAPIMSSLTSLELVGCLYLTDLSLRAMTKHLTNLESLKLNDDKCLTHSGLAHLASSNVGARLTWLEYNANSVKTIPSEIGNMASLVHLSMGISEITNIPPEIGKLVNLNELYLFTNQITQLSEQISNLTCLKVLQLAGNRLEHLPDELYTLTSLEKLSLDDNLLTELSSQIGNLSLLQRLSINENNISYLPETLWDLIQLQVLNFDSNQISTISDRIANLVNLTSLSFNENWVSSLPECISRLSNLKKLSADYNHLTSLPSGIGNLMDLTLFSVNNNELESLPPSLLSLQRLRALSVATNDGLSSSLCNLLRTREKLSPKPFPSLSVLSLEDTGLTELPETICSINSLTALSLDYNFLTTLPPELSQLDKLKSLTVDSNAFGGVFPEVVCQLTELQDLSLAENGLTEVADGITNLTKLHTLNLHANQFSSVPPQICSIMSLRALDLGANLISAIDDETRERLIYLKDHANLRGYTGEVPAGLEEVLKL